MNDQRTIRHDNPQCQVDENDQPVVRHPRCANCGVEIPGEMFTRDGLAPLCKLRCGLPEVAAP